jgi:hypothetical protein
MKTKYVSIVINPTAGNGKAKSAIQYLLEEIKLLSDI